MNRINDLNDINTLSSIMWMRNARKINNGRNVNNTNIVSRTMQELVFSKAEQFNNVYNAQGNSLYDERNIPKIKEKTPWYGNFGEKGLKPLSPDYETTVKKDRENLNNELNKLFKENGITFEEGEKFSIELDSLKNLKIKGLKDDKKAEKIKNLIENSKCTVTSNGKTFKKKMIGEIYDTMYSARNLNGEITHQGYAKNEADNFIHEYFGQSIKDLSYDKSSGKYLGANSELQKVLDGDYSNLIEAWLGKARKNNPEYNGGSGTCIMLTKPIIENLKEIVKNGQNSIPDFNFSINFENGKLDDGRL